MPDMTIDGETAYEPVVSLTDAARELVVSLRADEESPERLALWLEVSGANDGAYTYDLYFEAAADASGSDAVLHSDLLTVVVPETSVEPLRGATLDVVDGGLAVLNPNAPAGPPGGGDLSGEVAQRVMQVLETTINPSIASHGGAAELVAVEEGTAYLRLMGGCQGCGLAPVTLSQGIEVAIKEAVPEITAVMDVTDHAGGRNPYHQPAKK